MNGLMKLKPISEYKESDFDLTDHGYGNKINNRKEITKEEKILALTLLKERIQSEPLKFDDDNTPGCKDTWCNWGTCKEEGLFPHPESHKWPLDFISQGRAVPIKKPKCPMDERLNKPFGDHRDHKGCFWSCRIFQHLDKGGRSSMTKEQALELCDEAVAKVMSEVTE